MNWQLTGTRWVAFAQIIVAFVIYPIYSWSAGTTYGGLIVGVPGEGLESPVKVPYAGAVHVLYGVKSGISTGHNQLWSQDSSSILGDAETADNFGTSLAVGDFNGDNVSDVAIGTPLEDVSNLLDAGAVNIIYGAGSKFSATNNQIWTQASPNIQGASEQDDRFGSALAACDFNGDGKMDLAIGVPEEDVGPIRAAGAVNIIYGSSQGLTSAGNQLLLQSSFRDGIEPGDFFGSAVAVGNFNGDSYCDLVVGIPGEEPGAVGTDHCNYGAIAVWYGSAVGFVTPYGGPLVMHRGWPAIGGLGPNSCFGFALAAGNFNGDAYDDLAVGAPGKSGVNILYGSSTGFISPSPAPQFVDQDSWMLGTISEPYDIDRFGHALAAGDINGDGYDDLAIGAPEEDINGLHYDEGVVHVLYGDSIGLTGAGKELFHQKLSTVPGWAEPQDGFGSALAIGDINGDGYSDLAIGVSGENSYAGMVHVFYGSSGGIATTGSHLVGQHWSSIFDTAEKFDKFGAALGIFPHLPLE